MTRSDLDKQVTSLMNGIAEANGFDLATKQGKACATSLLSIALHNKAEAIIKAGTAGNRVTGLSAKRPDQLPPTVLRAVDEEIAAAERADAA